MTAPKPLDLGIALFGGVAVAAFLRPTSGQDSNPPVCWNALGAEVACDGSRWPLVAVAVAVGLLAIAWLLRSRSGRTLVP